MPRVVHAFTSSPSSSRKRRTSSTSPLVIHRVHVRALLEQELHEVGKAPASDEHQRGITRTHGIFHAVIAPHDIEIRAAHDELADRVGLSVLCCIEKGGCDEAPNHVVPLPVDVRAVVEEEDDGREMI